MGRVFQIPACLASHSLDRFYGEFMVTSSFSVFPTSLTKLECTNCRLLRDYSDASTPIASTPTAQISDGFNTDGSLNWSEIFTRLPNLVKVSFPFSTLKNKLPSSIPGGLTYFDLHGVRFGSDPGLYGSIPPAFFSTFAAAASTSFTMDLSNTTINGSIPANLFAPFSGKSYNTLIVDFSNTELSGTIPANLFSPLQSASMTRFSARFAPCSKLEGDLPSLPSDMIANAGSFTLNCSGSSLDGSIPNAYLENMPINAIVTLDLSHNRLIGPLPDYIFTSSNTPKTLKIDLGHNLISGPLTSFLSSSWNANNTAVTVSIALNDNALTGTIPETLLLHYPVSKRGSNYDQEDDNSSDNEALSSANSLTNDDALSHDERSLTRAIAAGDPVGLVVQNSFVLNLANNALTGSIPPVLLSIAWRTSGQIAGPTLIDLSNNSLNGTIPDLLGRMSQQLLGDFAVKLNNNSFTGPVPDFCRASTPMAIDLSWNNLTGPLPTSWASCKLSQVTLSYNSHLAGAMSSSLFSATGMSNFEAANTSISGDLPRLGVLTSFDLSSSSVDFCGRISLGSISGYRKTCLVQTTAACNCAGFYAQCGSSITCPAGVSRSECPAATRPGPEFFCSNGIWTAQVVTSPTLVVPPGAGTIAVLDDIESTKVIFNGLASHIEVNGCAANVSSVTLQLTPEQVEAIPSGTASQTLLSTSSTGCNLDSINLNAQIPNPRCKKVTTTKQVSPDGTTLSAVFSLQSTNCNTWWIILVSVLCGAIVIAVIIIVVSVMCCACCKRKVRPFAGTEGNHPV